MEKQAAPRAAANRALCLYSKAQMYMLGNKLRSSCSTMCVKRTAQLDAMVNDGESSRLIGGLILRAYSAVEQAELDAASPP